MSQKIKRILKRSFIVLLCFIIIIGLGIFFQLRSYYNEAKQLVQSMGKDAFSSSLTSIIYDANGEEIASMSAEKDCYYLSSKDIPYMAKLAFVTTEDRNFYSHEGIDYKAIVRATLAFIQEGEVTQGGSTITQQLARNIFLSHEVTLERKLKEIFIAGQLEETYTKEQLLEYYMNNIYFGNGFYGLAAASLGYYDKAVTELSLSELIYICAIPNNPNQYDPFTNPEATLKRRDRILKQMYERTDIDKSMYDEAVAETITLNPAVSKKSNYVETFVRHCAIRALMEQSGFTFQYSFSNTKAESVYEKEYDELYSQFSNYLFTKGYRIYTSIDMSMQKELQSTLNQHLKSYSTEKNEEGIFEFQGSAVCIDNNTGYVKAIVGGRSQNYNGYTLNRAYQSHRQPGSTIKPILTYTPLFSRGYTPGTIVVDEEIEDGPKNSPDVYEGEMTIRQAVIASKNTVAWSLYEKLGANTALQHLLDMQFSGIDSRDYVMATSIGGMTYGTSTLEMASAYAAIENGGVFRTPTCITKITDSEKNVIIENAIKSKKIYEENACLMMTDVLQDVLKKGTGKDYQVTNATCAAKTGTTNGNRDAWLVGYSSYYTTAVWTGYDYPRNIDEKEGTQLAGLIWHDFMTEIHKDKDRIDFAEYPGKEDELEEVDGNSTTKTTKKNQENNSEDDSNSVSETTGHPDVDAQYEYYETYQPTDEYGNYNEYETYTTPSDDIVAYDTADYDTISNQDTPSDYDAYSDYDTGSNYDAAIGLYQDTENETTSYELYDSP